MFSEGYHIGGIVQLSPPGNASIYGVLSSARKGRMLSFSLLTDEGDAIRLMCAVVASLPRQSENLLR